jgi:hypothetical protein
VVRGVTERHAGPVTATRYHQPSEAAWCRHTSPAASVVFKAGNHRFFPSCDQSCCRVPVDTAHCLVLPPCTRPSLIYRHSDCMPTPGVRAEQRGRQACPRQRFQERAAKASQQRRSAVGVRGPTPPPSLHIVSDSHAPSSLCVVFRILPLFPPLPCVALPLAVLRRCQPADRAVLMQPANEVCRSEHGRLRGHPWGLSSHTRLRWVDTSSACLVCLVFCVVLRGWCCATRSELRISRESASDPSGKPQTQP